MKIINHDQKFMIETLNPALWKSVINIISFKENAKLQQIQSKLLCFSINGYLLTNPAIICAYVNDGGGRPVV
jgi:hypothetical protein